METDSDIIHALIAKSLTDRLDKTETVVLENWKSECNENLQEYEDIVSLWLQSESLKMNDPLDLEKARTHIFGRTGILNPARRWVSRVVQVAAILILSIIFSGVYSYFRNNPEKDVTGSLAVPVYQEVKAAYGTQTKFQLSDGTTVYLNSGSKLHFPQTFTGQKQREVSLVGEGYFEVEKKAGQPFVVSTTNIDIKVLGTKFNVDAYAGDSQVSVALVEGSVSLLDHSGNKNKIPFSLLPKQVATLDTVTGAFTKAKVSDLNKYIAWIDGRIVFFDDPIQTVVKKLSNWYNVDIRIFDKKLEKYKFTGTFINEPIEQVLKVLSMTSQMTFTIEKAVKLKDNTMSKRKIILKSKS